MRSSAQPGLSGDQEVDSPASLCRRNHREGAGGAWGVFDWSGVNGKGDARMSHAGDEMSASVWDSPAAPLALLRTSIHNFTLEEAGVNFSLSEKERAKKTGTVHLQDTFPSEGPFTQR